jgi:protein-S-isoprenylcysteine O-methyltransferase Ste14
MDKFNLAFDFLRIILPIYFLLYFGIAFVLKSMIIGKRIGKTPLVLPTDDSPYGLIGLYFKITLLGMFLYVLLFSFLPKWYPYFLPIIQMQTNAIRYTGLGLLGFALFWTIVAQGQMKNSWRIGIDKELKTEFVTNGLFAHSRNPIFLGMIVSLIGLFLTTPNALTILFLILGYVLIQIQIRLEEEFLTELHQQSYLLYKQKVRRLI